MKTKNLAVSILVGVLVVAVWYTMLLKPTRAKVASVKRDTTTEQQKLAPLQHQLSQAQTDAAHAAEFKAQLESLQLALPNSPALAAFIRDANGIASAAGVTWQSVTHAAPVPALGGVESISVGLQVQGTYGQIVDYLSRLASLKRLLVVDTLQLAPGTNSTGSAGAGTSSQSSSQSTGPFSGGNQLTATISARMFATGGAALAAASGATGTPTVSAPAPATSTASTPSSG